MTNTDMFYVAKRAVINYFNEVHSEEGYSITEDHVFIVWFCKTLQHFKVLLSTVVSDGMYYEVTFNGDLNVVYLDAYKKWQHKDFNIIGDEQEAPVSEEAPLEEQEHLEDNATEDPIKEEPSSEEPPQETKKFLGKKKRRE